MDFQNNPWMETNALTKLATFEYADNPAQPRKQDIKIRYGAPDKMALIAKSPVEAQALL